MSKQRLVAAAAVQNLDHRWTHLSDAFGQMMMVRAGFGCYFLAAQGVEGSQSDRIIFSQHPSVVCVVRRSSDGFFALVHNWRPIQSLRDEVVDPASVVLEELGEFMWEFPGGLMEIGETDHEITALREGDEETGWVVQNPQTIGWYHPDPANNTTKIPIVLLDAVYENGNGHDEKDGINAVRWVSLNELLRMLRVGELSNGHTRNALLSYLMHQGLV